MARQFVHEKRFNQQSAGPSALTIQRRFLPSPMGWARQIAEPSARKQLELRNIKSLAAS
jgi:hypothetical protein